MSHEVSIINSNDIQRRIFTIRGQQVMVDRDLAELYQVETKALNQAVKRNAERFPEDFMFQLSKQEFEDWRSQIVTSNREMNLRSQTVTSSEHGGRRTLPYAFTEQGVAMLSAVLRSKAAIQTSIRVIGAFVEMRRFLTANGSLLHRLDTMEKQQIRHELQTDERFEKLFDALEDKSLARTQGIFFDGQVFDAYVFFNDLIRQAKYSIVLIDNYIDDSVLMQLTKRRKGVSAVILTKTVSARLKQDLKKHNAQYASIAVHAFPYSHDRFLILDGETVYHLGASLKDLGKKWFAFSRMDKEALSIMERVGDVLNRELSDV